LSEQVSEQVSESLKPRIDELNLWDCVHDLRDHGYTIVKDVAPSRTSRRLAHRAERSLCRVKDCRYHGESFYPLQTDSSIG
jgi:hypothetical protein